MTNHFAAFYTPESVAQILANWAIVRSDTSVLDPSFGGCAFLHAALNRLCELGNSNAGANIYGTDIDPSAQSYLADLYEAGASTTQFVQSDFFDIVPNQLNSDLFDVILGNPPYIRYHAIPEAAQKNAAAKLANYDITLSGRSSYWAYFLVYSLQFLKVGGRLAMVLPGAFLHTDYAQQIRDLIIQSFAKVTIFLLEERIFEGTEEESILLFAEGAHISHTSVRVGTVRTVTDLKGAVQDLGRSTREFTHKNNSSEWLSNVVDPEALDIYTGLRSSEYIIEAGEWVQTRIGVVTGNNDYFILSPVEWASRSLPTTLQKPIVRKAIQLNGLYATNDVLNSTVALKTSKHLLLRICPTEVVDEATKRYIEYGEKIGVNKAAKCQRKPWYAVPHSSSPAAFMPIMSASWPRIIVNYSDYTCTNNILKLEWKVDRNPNDWIRLALGTLSSICQFSAELVGRSYGGGVLKLEPKEFASLIIPLLPEATALEIAPKIDLLLQNKKLAEATSLVDETLIASRNGLTESHIVQLKAARDNLFLRRRSHRKDAQKFVSMVV